MLTSYFLLSVIHVIIGVVSGNKRDDQVTRDDINDDCPSFCEHGCCDHDECCSTQRAYHSGIVQIVAIVGGLLVTLVLVCLCYVRYKCVQRVNTRHYRDAQHRLRSQHVYSLSVSLELCRSQPRHGEASGGLELPPYSETDPLAHLPPPPGNPYPLSHIHAPDGTRELHYLQVMPGEQPPAYSPAVKVEGFTNGPEEGESPLCPRHSQTLPQPPAYQASASSSQSQTAAQLSSLSSPSSAPLPSLQTSSSVTVSRSEVGGETVSGGIG